VLRPSQRRWIIGPVTRTRGFALPYALLSLALGVVVCLAVLSVPDAGRADPLAASPTVPAKKHKKPLRIEVLSGRADLVTGGSALVAVELARKADAKTVRIRLGDKNVTRKFARDGKRRLVALLGGLRNGRNTLTAQAGNKGARLTLVNHPHGGPLISGPQLKPWVCQAGAVDAQCNQAPRVVFQYRSTDPTKTGFQPYDPAHPATDVAKTHAMGIDVPFIIRVETGYQDRDQYQLSTLYQPGKPWSPTKPQPQFGHKMLITHGASCAVDHQTGSAPATTGTATTDRALGRGWVVMSTALNNSGHNCNIAVQAESMIMAKELAIKRFGTLRYTIGTGCSGGSLAEQWVANAYPGIYQGLLPTCSFPDAYSTATQFLDYHLLLAYLSDPSKWDIGSGVVWTPTQMGDVLGGVDGYVNAQVSENAQFHVAVPTDPCAGVTDAQRYEPTSNPGGVRCSIQDAAINIFGPEEQRFWTANEHEIGRGFVRLPVDNVGVQYGLESLLGGSITPAQFVDLNVKAGGADVDTNFTAARLDNGNSTSLGRAYRSGLVNEANNLDQVAIIDCRGPNPGLFHDAYRAFTIRERLQREHGTHANQVIWEGPVPILGDTNCELASFLVMDTWLRSVETDRAGGSLAAKVIRNKPAGVTDRCYDGAGQQLTSTLCPDAVVPIEGTPRMVAGDAITTDANKCRLKPLTASDYPGIVFTPTQWSALQALYPGGVCDFTRPGVAQQDTVPWLTYQDAGGQVIYGGKPLGKAPTSKPFHASP
jgi:hypothetical protein